MGFRQTTISGCCKDCQERFPACHDVCAAYLQAKAEWEEHKETIRERRNQERVMNTYHYDRVTKTKRILTSKGKRFKNG